MAVLVVCFDSSTGNYLAQLTGSAQIANGAITSSKIASGQVGMPHIYPGAVTSSKIASGQVGMPHIYPGAVTSSKIASGQVGIPHIYPGAVTSAKIGANAVGTPHIRDLNVTSAKLAAAIIGLLGTVADEAITSAKLASGAVIGDRIAAAAITSSKIASGQVGIPHIYAEAVISAKIGALAVGTPHIAANAIVSGKVASGGLAPLTSGKIWGGFTGNVPREENKPVRYTDVEAKAQAEGAKLDDHAVPDDNTDLDASAAKHGLMPKTDKSKLDDAASAATASKLVIRDASARAKFAAPGAAGDVLIKGTRVTTAELPAMTDEKIWKGTGGNVEEVDMPTAGDSAASALEGDLALQRAGAGTINNSTYINDGDTGATNVMYASAVDQYVTVEFYCLLWISQYRYFKHLRAGQNDDAEFKIEYWNEGTGAYAEWITGVVVSYADPAAWSSWDTSPSRVLTRKIKLTATKLDTGVQTRMEMRELQVKD